MSELSLMEKFAAIRDSLGVIAMQSSDGERSFEFTAAEDVLRRVRPKLAKHRLVVEPQVLGSATRGKTTIAQLGLKVTDLDDVDGEPRVARWEGEADEGGLAAAIKNGLKTYYLATFQIRTEPADAAPRRRARKTTGADGLVGDDERDLTNAKRAADKAGLDADELAALLFERFGVRKLEHVAKKRTTDMLDNLRVAGENKAAGRDPLAREHEQAVRS